MKNLFTLISICLCILGVKAQTETNCNCDEIVHFPSPLRQDYADLPDLHLTTTHNAQAYYWEICDGNATINGSNTEQTVHIGNYSNYSIVKLTTFKNGLCHTYCDYIGNPGPGDCPTPDPDIWSVDLPGDYAPWDKGEVENIFSNIDPATVDSLHVSLVCGTFLDGQLNGLQSGTVIVAPPYRMAYHFNGCMGGDLGYGVHITYYFNNNCPDQTIVVIEAPDYHPPELRSGRSLIKVFPNPTNSTIKIQGTNLGKSKLLIYDLQGNLKLTKSKLNINTNIDVSILPKGIYIYKIINPNGISKKGKIIRE